LFVREISCAIVPRQVQDRYGSDSPK